MILGLWATHRHASMQLIERLAVPNDQLAERLRVLHDIHGVQESFILSTCNRVEAYVVAETTHTPSILVSAVRETLTGLTNLPPDDSHDAIVVETGDEVVRHVVAVACGLDSMIIGECQIVGQIRRALRVAEEEDTIGPVLGMLIRTALRTSKRARSTTTIGGISRSMVDVGVERAAEICGGLASKSGLLIGAGKMGALAGPLLRKAGIHDIVVTNRTDIRARHLAEKIQGVAVSLTDLVDALSAADVVISSTGAPEIMVTAEQVRAAMSRRADTPLVFVDVALPRDIDPKVRDIPQVTVIDIEDIGVYVRDRRATDDVAAVWSMVDDAVEEFRRWRGQSHAAGVIGALRVLAAGLVESEVRRLHTRLPWLDSQARQETDMAVRRVVDKLLHTPTVQVKDLATTPEGSQYVQALALLFDLKYEEDS